MPTNFYSSDQASLIQAALQAFLNAQTPEEIDAVRANYPVADTEAFEAAIQRLIDHASAAGDPDAVLRMQNRLEMLYDAQELATMTPLERAVDAFLGAVDEESARVVFAEEHALLATPQARDLLDGIEAGDPESARLLAERRALLAELSS